MWMLDYLHILLEDLLKNPSKKMKEASKAAYDAALGPHHPWLIRKTASVAVAAVPTKEEFLQKTNCDETALAEIVEKLGILRTSLWGFYKENGIDQLD